MVGDVDPGTLIAARDAQDRADRIEGEDEAASMLRRATMSNDATLATAIGLKAYNRGWSDVATTWANDWDKSNYIDMFEAIPSGGKNTKAADAAIFRVRAPEELGLVGDHDLENLAEQEVTS
jgi:hypothetical protein